MSPSSIRCRILGQAEIHTRGIRLTPESELQFGLALYFCAQAGREIPRDELASLFWPKHDVEAGRHCLRQSIYRLRVLGVAVRSGARASVLDTDVVDTDFAPAIADDARAAAFLQLDDVAILPGYAPRFSRPFSHWVEDFRGEISSRMRRGLVRAISEMRARGRYADVERLCRFCLRLDPLNEEATLALAESVALAGSKAEAVDLIDRYENEVGRYRSDLRISSSLLRERISDRLIRRSEAPVDLPMIGREQDVERVLSAFQRLRGNHAISYVITGAAGVGKTRLAHECCRMAELQGVRLLTIETQPSSRTQALFAVSQLIDGLLQMPGAIGCAPAALECLRAMSSPVSVPEPSTLDVDGEARFAMVRWSILDVLDAILIEGPLVIHIDDAHQLDEQSQFILQDALGKHAKRPLLMLFTMRKPEPTDVDRYSRLTDTSITHELSMLSDVSCDALITQFCTAHEESLDPAIRERMTQLSAGNPLFLLELLKHRAAMLSDQLPLTVQALLEDRLGRLSHEALSVLRAVAILGLNSTVSRLNSMVDEHRVELLGALTELHAAGMLSAVGGGACCRHDIIREAVLSKTPLAARTLLHRRAAQTLGRDAIREGGVALLWECVHHWRSAGSVKQGLQTARALGRRLLTLGLAKDALVVFTDAENRAVDDASRLKALVGKGKALRMLRDWERLSEVSFKERAATSHLPRRTHTLMELFGFEAHFYSHETFCELPTQIRRCVHAESASKSHRLAAATMAVISADNHGDEEQARALYEAVRHIKPDDDRQRIDLLTIAAVFHAAFGDATRVAQVLEELVDLCRQVRNPAIRARLLRRASWGLCRFSPRRFATEVLEEAIEIFERLALFKQLPPCFESLCAVHMQEGAYESIERILTRVHEIRVMEADFYTRGVEYEIRVRYAFEVDSPKPIENLQSPADVVSALNRSTRGRLTAAALQIAESLLRGTESQVRDAVAVGERLRNEIRVRCDQDFFIAALTTGFVRQGLEVKARRVLNAYLTHERREPDFLMPSIVKLAKQLGALESDGRVDHSVRLAQPN